VQILPIYNSQLASGLFKTTQLPDGSTKHCNIGKGEAGAGKLSSFYVLRLDCSSSSKGGKERNSRDGERGRGLSYITMAIADVS
jgi:hypothetical protein